MGKGNSKHSAEEEEKVVLTFAALNEELSNLDQHIKGLALLSNVCSSLQSVAFQLDVRDSGIRTTKEKLENLAAEYRGLEARTIVYVRSTRRFADQVSQAGKSMLAGTILAAAAIPVIRGFAERVYGDLGASMETHAEILSLVLALHMNAQVNSREADERSQDALAWAMPGVSVVQGIKQAAESVDHPVGKIALASMGFLGGLLSTVLFPITLPIAMNLREKFERARQQWTNIRDELGRVSICLCDNKAAVSSVIDKLDEVSAHIGALEQLLKYKQNLEYGIEHLGNSARSLQYSCDHYLALTDRE